jgi:hypothetical protein
MAAVARLNALQARAVELERQALCAAGDGERRECAAEALACRARMLEIGRGAA